MKRARECKNWGVGLTFHQSRGGGGGMSQSGGNLGKGLPDRKWHVEGL